MFLPLVSLLLHFGEIQRYTDIILLSWNPTTISAVRLSSISRFAQFAFIQVNPSDRDETLVNLNFKSTPNLVCFQINDTTEVAALEETIWFLEGVIKLCDDNLEILSNNASTSKQQRREYFWHTSVCICVIWPTSPRNDTEMSPEILAVILKNRMPKQYQIDSCVYFWFLDTNLFFEVYYFRNTLIVRNVSVQHLNPKSSVNRRGNFEMASITAGHVKGWGMVSPNGRHTLTSSTTTTYHCLAYMQDYLNFTVIIVRNADWNAMEEKVKTRKVDIGISATAMIPSLTKDLRFLSTPTYTEQLVAYFNIPDESNFDMNFLHVKPFSRNTWLATFIVLGLLFLVHYAMSGEIINSWLYIISCLTMQGYSRGVRNSIRIVTFIGALLFVILYALYSGELISSLSTKKEKVYSANDLIEMGFMFGIKNDSYLRKAQEFGDFGMDSLAAKIFANLHSKMGEPASIEQALSFIFRDAKKYAFICEESVLEKVDSVRKGAEDRDTYCDSLRDSPIPEYTVQQTPIVRRDSPYIDHFNVARLRMTETGIWHLHWKRVDTNTTHMKPQCKESKTPSFEINDVLLPLFIMISGFALSIVIFLVEFNCRCENPKLQPVWY